MEKTLSKDMTSGNEGKSIIMFTLPMLAGNLLQQIYNLADTAVVGKFIGDNALAAVGATGSITYFFYTLCLGFSIGSGVIISQLFGARDMKKVRSAVVSSAAVTGILGIIISILSVILTRSVLILLNTPETLLGTSVGYMHITCGGTIAVAAYNWITAVMRSLGDSKTPLIFLCIANVINIGLDLLFVCVFGMGVNGAAAATVTAQGCSAVFCVIYAFRRNECLRLTREELCPERSMLIRCIRTGVPIAMQNGLVSVSMIMLQRVTNSFGETVMSAYTVSMRIEQLIQQPFGSLSSAVSTFIGQNTGAGKKDRVLSGYRFGMKAAVVLAVFVMGMFFLFGRRLASCFVNTDEVIGLAYTAMRITSVCYVFLGAIHVTRGFLNGAGDTDYALINGITEVICRVGLSLVLTKIPFIGCYGIWLTTCITWIVTAVVSMIRYYSRFASKCREIKM